MVTRMVRDLDLAVEVVGLPICREEDGLAMSRWVGRGEGWAVMQQHAIAEAGKLNVAMSRWGPGWGGGWGG